MSNLIIKEDDTTIAGECFHIEVKGADSWYAIEMYFADNGHFIIINNCYHNGQSLYMSIDRLAEAAQSCGYSPEEDEFHMFEVITLLIERYNKFFRRNLSLVGDTVIDLDCIPKELKELM